MFTPCYQKTTETPYIRHPSYENLFVLPYVNGRLVFAELAARAINNGQFDLIATDLPYFMQTDNWLEIPIGSFPFLSSLIIKTSDTNFRTFNFTPNDAACISAYQVRKLQSAGSVVEFECLDDSNIISYPEVFFNLPFMDLTDDYFALIEGVGLFFSDVYKKLSLTWETFSTEQKLYWNYRATIVASRLNECLKKGKKTLFVCNYMLWWLVNIKLISGNFTNKNIIFSQWKNQSATLLFQNPNILWIKGVLDDYPAIVYSFFKKLMGDNLDSFDKLHKLNKIISDVIDEIRDKKNQGISIRRLMAFRKYLRTRLGINCKITPTPHNYLYDAVVSCLGKSLAKTILNKLVDYPSPDENFTQFLKIKYDNITMSDEAFEMPDDFHETTLNAGLSMDSRLPSGDCQSEELQREMLMAKIRPFIKKNELKHLTNNSGVTWALKQEYIMHGQVNKLVRKIVERKSKEYRSVKSWGSMGDGIDWKATIRSKVTGDGSIYVKKSKKNEFEKLNLNTFVPTVFILHNSKDIGYPGSVHDSNITQRYIDKNKKDLITPDFPAPDYVYSIFYLKEHEGYMCDQHITINSIFSILFLCTHPWMGTERYKQITKRPQKFQCRKTPEQDKELLTFKYPDRLVACGIKYAEKSVVVVSEDTWQPAPETLKFAKQKNIRIIRISLSNFSQELTNNLSHMHFISTPLKNHPNHEEIIRRYVPYPFGP